MNLSTLKPAKGAVKKNVKRIGRGQGSARGGTSGRGHKGAKSRSGYKSKVGFEGGQMPIQRRLPKNGFKSLNKEEFKLLNLDRINDIVEKYNRTDLSLDTLKSLKLIPKLQKLKILGRGELKVKVDIEAHAISNTAKTAIEQQGGTIKIV